MIFAYVAGADKLLLQDASGDAPLPAMAVWIDLFEPTAAEKDRVERQFALSLPTHAEMREIEPSNRLYVEGASTYMTATFIARADEPNPTGEAITFILVGRDLITLRYSDPRPIGTCAARVTKHLPQPNSGTEVLIALLEAFVNRMADILEKASLDLDGLSQLIFHERPTARRRRLGDARDLQIVLKGLGRGEDITSTVRESLISLTRLVRFLVQNLDANAAWDNKEQKQRLRQLRSDIVSLNEHVGFETQKTMFLLDATLGMINIEQNRIIKIFSVAAVIFLPPTLVASLYGMNFKHIPELDWLWGYPYVLTLMVLSAAVPYLFFRRKGWL
ncbi:MAG: magnesium transporter [Alphaproteobacteria bacterium]|nr:magnesium transporter [Alphaproteobacteria bacterium]